MTDTLKKDLTTRLSSVEGHIKAIKTMLNDGKSCEDILLQISAVESAINKVGKLMLKNHLNTCVKQSIKNGDSDILDKFNNILDKYI